MANISIPGAPMQYYSPALFYQNLPFTPTTAQKRAISEAFADMCSDKRMNRLLQGDVGSGKTLVAAACAWLAAKNGYQTAIMVPTEVLARQHFETLNDLFVTFGLHCACLTAATPKRQKQWIKDAAAVGAVDLVVGTHALIESDVMFYRPGLFIIDEQHRFGVRQREALSTKSIEAHTLVMSATPIPRTLTLIIYGDLDISVLDEMPPGRQKILTYPATTSMYARVWRFAAKQIQAGGQVYIVCPLIEESEQAANRVSATQLAETLQKEVFPSLTIGLLHGRQSAAEKDAIMQDFAAGAIHILVSTTVIEVGVDVPNATLMIIENADLFGLSQLHQLRGRVGRGSRQSYCILVSGDSSDVAKKRLQTICRLNDGFQIAEEDLKLRGPGDFLGSRQHGLPAFKVASLATNLDVLQEAQQAATSLLQQDPQLTQPDHATLADMVQAVFERQPGITN